MIQKTKSLVSAFTIFSFIFNQVMTPLPVLAASIPLVNEIKINSNFKLDIPSDLGTIEQVHAGSGPALIQIQTAHGNFEAQKKIQSLLQYLDEKYGFDLVLMEGATKKLEPELLRLFPDRMDITLAIAEDMTHKALVKGPELFMIEHPEVQGYGIEEEKSYLENGESFREVLREQEKTESFVRDLAIQIERLTSPYLNKNLKEFLKRLESFEANLIPIDGWLTSLHENAKEILSLDLADPIHQLDWPMLVRIFNLREIEKKMDMAAYQVEREKFLKAMGNLPEELKHQVSELITIQMSHHQLPDPETGLLVEALIKALPQDFPYENYPNIKYFLGHAVLQSEMKGDMLLNEMDRLSWNISEKLAKTSEEKEILALLKDHRLLQKLFRLEMAPRDYRELMERQDEIHTENLIRRFQELNGSGRVKDIRFEHLKEIQQLFLKAVRFYEGVQERDGWMLENIEKRLKETGKNKAVVVTGGFHAGPFKDYFLSKDFNYALISPKISTLDGREAYIQATLQDDSNIIVQSTRETASLLEPLPRDGNVAFLARETAGSVVSSLSRFGIRSIAGEGVRVMPAKQGYVQVGFDSPELFGKVDLLVPVEETTEVLEVTRQVLQPDLSRSAVIRSETRSISAGIEVSRRVYRRESPLFLKWMNLTYKGNQYVFRLKDTADPSEDGTEMPINLGPGKTFVLESLRDVVYVLELVQGDERIPITEYPIEFELDGRIRGFVKVGIPAEVEKDPHFEELFEKLILGDSKGLLKPNPALQIISHKGQLTQVKTLRFNLLKSMRFKVKGIDGEYIFDLKNSEAITRESQTVFNRHRKMVYVLKNARSPRQEIATFEFFLNSDAGIAQISVKQNPRSGEANVADIVHEWFNSTPFTLHTGTTSRSEARGEAVSVTEDGIRYDESEPRIATSILLRHGADGYELVSHGLSDVAQNNLGSVPATVQYTLLSGTEQIAIFSLTINPDGSINDSALDEIKNRHFTDAVQAVSSWLSVTTEPLLRKSELRAEVFGPVRNQQGLYVSRRVFSDSAPFILTSMAFAFGDRYFDLKLKDEDGVVSGGSNIAGKAVTYELVESESGAFFNIAEFRVSFDSKGQIEDAALDSNPGDDDLEVVRAVGGWLNESPTRLLRSEIHSEGQAFDEVEIAELTRTLKKFLENMPPQFTQERVWAQLYLDRIGKEGINVAPEWVEKIRQFVKNHMDFSLTPVDFSWEPARSELRSEKPESGKGAGQASIIVKEPGYSKSAPFILTGAHLRIGETDYLFHAKDPDALSGEDVNLESVLERGVVYQLGILSAPIEVPVAELKVFMRPDGLIHDVAVEEIRNRAETATVRLVYSWLSENPAQLLRSELHVSAPEIQHLSAYTETIYPGGADETIGFKKSFHLQGEIPRIFGKVLLTLPNRFIGRDLQIHLIPGQKTPSDFKQLAEASLSELDEKGLVKMGILGDRGLTEIDITDLVRDFRKKYPGQKLAAIRIDLVNLNHARWTKQAQKSRTFPALAVLGFDPHDAPNEIHLTVYPRRRSEQRQVARMLAVQDQKDPVRSELRETSLQERIDLAVASHPHIMQRVRELGIAVGAGQFTAAAEMARTIKRLLGTGIDPLFDKLLKDIRTLQRSELRQQVEEASTRGVTVWFDDDDKDKKDPTFKIGAPLASVETQMKVRSSRFVVLMGFMGIDASLSDDELTLKRTVTAEASVTDRDAFLAALRTIAESDAVSVRDAVGFIHGFVFDFIGESSLMVVPGEMNIHLAGYGVTVEETTPGNFKFTRTFEQKALLGFPDKVKQAILDILPKDFNYPFLGKGNRSELRRSRSAEVKVTTVRINNTMRGRTLWVLLADHNHLKTIRTHTGVTGDDVTQQLISATAKFSGSNEEATLSGERALNSVITGPHVVLTYPKSELRSMGEWLYLQSGPVRHFIESRRVDQMVDQYFDQYKEVLKKAYDDSNKIDKLQDDLKQLLKDTGIYTQADEGLRFVLEQAKSGLRTDLVKRMDVLMAFLVAFADKYPERMGSMVNWPQIDWQMVLDDIEKVTKGRMVYLFGVDHEVLQRNADGQFEAAREHILISPVEGTFDWLSWWTLRAPRSWKDGIRWMKRNIYIFGGGFGYDIRINNSISERYSIAKFAYAMGRTLGGSAYLNHKGRALITGDQRFTSDMFRMAMIQGLADERIDVVTQDDGVIITTGLTSRKSLADDFDLAMQWTGSHNTAEGNGGKITYKGLPFFQNDLVRLAKNIAKRKGWSLASQYANLKIEKQKDMIQEHIEALDKVLPRIENGASVIADFRHGAAGEVFTALAERQGYKVIERESLEAPLPDEIFEVGNQPIMIAIHTNPDPNMPAGIWDPSKDYAYTQIFQLQERIYKDQRFQGRRYGGILFDGDGDRSGLVTEGEGLEHGSEITSSEMLIAFYMQMMEKNIEGIRALNQMGEPFPIKVTMDVRSTSVIKDLLKKFAQEHDLNITGEFVGVGFPVHRQFVLEELTRIQAHVEKHRGQLNAEQIKAIEKLMRDYRSAEASGHFFFNVLPKEQFFKKKIVVDDGIVTAYRYLDLAGELGKTLAETRKMYPSLPMTHEIRLEKAPADVLKKQELAEKAIITLLELHGDELLPEGLTIEAVKKQVAAARKNPPKRQDWDDPLLLVDGIRIQMKNGVWLLSRKSNTSAVIGLRGEVDSWAKRRVLAQTIVWLSDALHITLEFDRAYRGLDFKLIDREIDILAKDAGVPRAELQTAGAARSEQRQVAQKLAVQDQQDSARSELREELSMEVREAFNQLIKNTLAGRHVDRMTQYEMGFRDGLQGFRGDTAQKFDTDQKVRETFIAQTTVDYRQGYFEGDTRRGELIEEAKRTVKQSKRPGMPFRWGSSSELRQEDFYDQLAQQILDFSDQTGGQLQVPSYSIVRYARIGHGPQDLRFDITRMSDAKKQRVWQIAVDYFLALKERGGKITISLPVAGSASRMNRDLIPNYVVQAMIQHPEQFVDMDSFKNPDGTWNEYGRELQEKFGGDVSVYLRHYDPVMSVDGKGEIIAGNLENHNRVRNHLYAPKALVPADQETTFRAFHLINVKIANDQFEAMGLGRPFIAQEMASEKYYPALIRHLAENKAFGLKVKFVDEAGNVLEPAPENISRIVDIDHDDKESELIIYNQPLVPRIVTPVSTVDRAWQKDLAIEVNAQEMEAALQSELGNLTPEAVAVRRQEIAGVRGEKTFMNEARYRYARAFSQKYEGQALDDVLTPGGHGWYHLAKFMGSVGRRKKPAILTAIERGVEFDYVHNVDNMRMINDAWMLVFGHMIEDNLLQILESSVKPSTERGGGGAQYAYSWVEHPDGIPIRAWDGREVKAILTQMETKVLLASLGNDPITNKPNSPLLDRAKEQNLDDRGIYPTTNNASEYIVSPRLDENGNLTGDDVYSRLVGKDKLAAALASARQGDYAPLRQLTNVMLAGMLQMKSIKMIPDPRNPSPGPDDQIASVVSEIMMWDTQLGEGVRQRMDVVVTGSLWDLENRPGQVALDEIEFNPLKDPKTWIHPVAQAAREASIARVKRGDLFRGFETLARGMAQMRSELRVAQGKYALQWGVTEEFLRENKSKMAAIFISGGEDAGINDYFAFQAHQIRTRGLIPVAVMNGIQGFVGENLHERLAVIDKKDEDNLIGRGGALAGTSRINLNKEIKNKNFGYVTGAIRNMAGFAEYYPIGGGDHATFWTTFKKLIETTPELESVREISKYYLFGRMNVIYKTVDGDVFGQPLGFMTAVEQVQRVVYGAAASGAAMDQITLIPAMGADVGRLVVEGASRNPRNLKFLNESQKLADRQLAKDILTYGPSVMILIPEIPVPLKTIVERARQIKKENGHVVIVMGEAFRINPDDEILKALITEGSPQYDAEATLAWRKYLTADADPHGNVKWAKTDQATLVGAALRRFFKEGKETKIRQHGKIDYGSLRGVGSAVGAYDREYAALLARKMTELTKASRFGLVVSLPADDLLPYQAPFLLDTSVFQTYSFETVREVNERFGNIDLPVRVMDQAGVASSRIARINIKFHALLARSLRELIEAGVLVPDGYQDQFEQERIDLREFLQANNLAGRQSELREEMDLRAVEERLEALIETVGQREDVQVTLDRLHQMMQVEDTRLGTVSSVLHMVEQGQLAGALNALQAIQNPVYQAADLAGDVEVTGTVTEVDRLIDQAIAQLNTLTRSELRNKFEPVNGGTSAEMEVAKKFGATEAEMARAKARVLEDLGPNAHSLRGYAYQLELAIRTAQNRSRAGNPPGVHDSEFRPYVGGRLPEVELAAELDATQGEMERAKAQVADNLGPNAFKLKGYGYQLELAIRAERNRRAGRSELRAKGKFDFSNTSDREMVRAIAQSALDQNVSMVLADDLYMHINGWRGKVTVDEAIQKLRKEKGIVSQGGKEFIVGDERLHPIDAIAMATLRYVLEERGLLRSELRKRVSFKDLGSLRGKLWWNQMEPQRQQALIDFLGTEGTKPVNTIPFDHHRPQSHYNHVLSANEKDPTPNMLLIARNMAPYVKSFLIHPGYLLGRFNETSDPGAFRSLVELSQANPEIVKKYYSGPIVLHPQLPKNRKYVIKWEGNKTPNGAETGKIGERPRNQGEELGITLEELAQVPQVIGIKFMVYLDSSQPLAFDAIMREVKAMSQAAHRAGLLFFPEDLPAKTINSQKYEEAFNLKTLQGRRAFADWAADNPLFFAQGLSENNVDYDAYKFTFPGTLETVTLGNGKTVRLMAQRKVVRNLKQMARDTKGRFVMMLSGGDTATLVAKVRLSAKYLNFVGNFAGRGVWRKSFTAVEPVPFSDQQAAQGVIAQISANLRGESTLDGNAREQYAKLEEVSLRMPWWQYLGFDQLPLRSELRVEEQINRESIQTVIESLGEIIQSVNRWQVESGREENLAEVQGLLKGALQALQEETLRARNLGFVLQDLESAREYVDEITLKDGAEPIDALSPEGVVTKLEEVEAAIKESSTAHPTVRAELRSKANAIEALKLIEGYAQNILPGIWKSAHQLRSDLSANDTHLKKAEQFIDKYLIGRIWAATTNVRPPFSKPGQRYSDVRQLSSNFRAAIGKQNYAGALAILMNFKGSVFWTSYSEFLELVKDNVNHAVSILQVLTRSELRVGDDEHAPYGGLGLPEEHDLATKLGAT
ncbi:MAG: 6-phosphofructokinase, partial [Candidatus Omnitrophica bacterium]|nr:6-phosphofructokinase [Candidatus Omnitrophota bacterium]